MNSGKRIRHARVNLLNRRQTLKLGGASALALGLAGCSGNSQERSDVIVIGAGLSGLHAAMLLEAEGAKVTVLEANERIGGRIFSQDDIPGNPEAGGMQIGAMYARVRSVVDELGLEMYDPAPEFPSTGMILGGQSVAPQDWAESPVNKTVGPERAMPPFALSRLYVSTDNPLAELDSWLESSSAALDVPFDQYLKSKGASDEAIRLLEIPNVADTIGQISALSELRKDRINQFEAANGMFSFLKGGMSRLPEAMATSLNTEVQRGKKVTAISNGDTLAEVQCEDGSSYTADFVIVTLPFTVLRDVKMDPPLQGAQADAVNSLPLSQVTQVFMSIKEPYWEQDGMPGSMFTDGPLERLWTLPGPNSATELLWIFMNGDREKPLRGMSNEDIVAFAYDELVKLRPSAEGRVEPLKAWSWSNNPYSKGAYAYFAPGQINAFASEMAAPAGRLHFAGEHTAELQTGMEGAMESGERAVFEVLDQLQVG